MLKKRPVAAFLMLLMMAAAVWLGGFRSLHALEKGVSDAFINGVDGDGYSIQSDLTIILEQSYNVVTIAKHYFDEKDASVEAVLAAREALSKAAFPDDKCTANTAVYETTAALYFQLRDHPSVTETHKKLLAQYYTEIQSRNDTIKNDGYNAKAREFNAILSEFPASVVSGLVGVEPARMFE